MSYAVDWTDVSTVGLTSSPVAEALAGLRANEARYFKNKYDLVFTTVPADDAREAVDRVERILTEERGIEIASPVLEVARFEVEGVDWTYLFYESGLSINVLWTLEPGGKRAVLQALRRRGRARRALGVQVRAAALEARRHDPGLLLRDQGAVLT